jgi:hypothetical protein
MNVLSTTSTAPAPWAISAALAMSVTARVGLAGVSMNTTRVRSVIAALSRSGSLVSTIVAATPNRVNSRSSTTRVGPYTDAPHTTWSPDERSAKKAVETAAIPDAVANASVPSSNSATLDSSIAVVGFPIRV